MRLGLLILIFVFGYRSAGQTVPPVDGPTKNFRWLAYQLDSLGFKSDTVRVANVRMYKELLNVDVQQFEAFPFYKMNKRNTAILWRNTRAFNQTDSLDTEIFLKAESVWGYFYQKEETKNVRTDGVIEQWKFIDAATAQTAMDELNKFYPLPYFNTQPYYLTDGPFLFVFHTRADAFSYRQKEFFKKFRELSSAPANNHKR